MRLVLVQSESSGLFLVTHTVTHGERGVLPGGLPARGDRAESATGFCLFYIETK